MPLLKFSNAIAGSNTPIDFWKLSVRSAQIDIPARQLGKQPLVLSRGYRHVKLLECIGSRTARERLGERRILENPAYIFRDVGDFIRFNCDAVYHVLNQYGISGIIATHDRPS